MMKKERAKHQLENLIKKENEINQTIRKVVFDYLVETGVITKDNIISPEDITYKKIIREEFGLVI